MAPKILTPGTTKKSGGDTYEWLGAQWRNKRTGRIATRDVAANLTREYTSGRKYSNEELSDWFTDRVKDTKGDYRRKLRKVILSDADRKRSHPVIGKMFIYEYDPKWKDILPIYDRFPLCFPIEPYNDGFLGLNLHYLSIEERSTILNRLSKFLNNQNYDETTRLRMSYQLLNSTKQLATLARPCIKRYLYNHVRSQFIEITADEWDKAIELPIQVFVRKK